MHGSYARRQLMHTYIYRGTHNFVSVHPLSVFMSELLDSALTALLKKIDYI